MWADEFQQAARNAAAYEWFISPLEYHWPDGKKTADAMFRPGGAPNPRFDEIISPGLFRSSMQVDFRAKMMVYAFMRQDISKKFGVEIESGLSALYQLDFYQCLSQWIYVIEGYCRKLFSVTASSNVKSAGWTVPVTGQAGPDSIIRSIADALMSYFDGVLFAHAPDPHIERLSRHLLLHGNAENKDIFSQKNCLILMFILDALVTIEMVSKGHFPAVFHDLPGEKEKVGSRVFFYQKQLDHAFSDQNLLKIKLLAEHV